MRRQTGTPDGDTEYNFSGGTSYPDSQDTAARPAGDAGGYTYDPSPAGDATAAVPAYPASLTEPVGGTAHDQHQHERRDIFQRRRRIRQRSGQPRGRP